MPVLTFYKIVRKLLHTDAGELFMLNLKITYILLKEPLQATEHLRVSFIENSLI